MMPGLIITANTFTRMTIMPTPCPLALLGHNLPRHRRCPRLVAGTSCGSVLLSVHTLYAITTLQVYMIPILEFGISTPLSLLLLPIIPSIFLSI